MKGTNESANCLDFWVLGSKFTKFLSFLKQQICFSSNFASLFSIMRYITPLYLFSWSFIYFQQKEPIKVQVWWNFTWLVKSLKFCTLMGSFYKNHIKFQLKKYKRIISHDTEKGSKLWRKTGTRNLVNFNASSGKSENLHFDGLLLSKVCNVWAKKIQKSCVVKNDLWFQKWHKSFSEFWHK